MNILEPTHSRIDAQDVVILFADLQAGILELSQTNPPDRLKKSVKGLAKLATLFEIPVIVTGIQGEDGSPAKITPDIGEVMGELPTHHRTTWFTFRNPEIVAAIEATGRKTLILSGVATELAVQLHALTGADQGYKTYAALDACGGVSERTDQAALLRIAHSGRTAVSVSTLAGDFREPKAQRAIGIPTKWRRDRLRRNARRHGRRAQATRGMPW